MLINRKSIIVLALSGLLAFPLFAGAADTADSTNQAVSGGGRITRIQAIPSTIVIGNTEYSLPHGTTVLGIAKEPVGIDKLKPGMNTSFTIQEPSTPGDRSVITSIRVLPE